MKNFRIHSIIFIYNMIQYWLYLSYYIYTSLVLIFLITGSLYLSIAFIQFSFHLATTNIIYFSLHFFLFEIKLTHIAHQFLLYIIVVQYFHPFQNDQQDKSSYPLSAYKDVTVIDYIFPCVFHTCDSFILKLEVCTSSSVSPTSFLPSLPANCFLCL